MARTALAPIHSGNEDLPTGLYWKGKTTEVPRVSLPFQTIETINNDYSHNGKYNGDTWYNRLIWGENKYIMSSLLDEFAGKIDLIYIDPPFATGADFRVKVQIGETDCIKEPSILEEKAYRDTWGQGLDSYLQMLYERLLLMRELLSPHGSIYIHLDWRMSAYIKVIADEVFGQECYTREVIWRIGWISGYKSAAKNWIRNHDTILYYVKTPGDFTFNKEYVPYPPGYQRRGGNGSGKGYPIENVWNANPFEFELKGEESLDSIQIKSFSQEKTGYDTQKNESILARIIKASSNKGDLIADLFCGSGTTGAVAEKLGRRWIMADLSRYAIHTTRKRLLGIENCTPFKVQNLGKYERQYWQGVTFKRRADEQEPIYEYIQFILKLYRAEPLHDMLHIHGKQGKRLVHVGAVDAPVTFAEVQEAIDEARKTGLKFLDILGWEWEMGLHEIVEKEAEANGLHLRLVNIPRDVMDPGAVEKGDITFYELAYVEAIATPQKDGQIKVELKNFAIPNRDLVPREVRDKIKNWADYIDYWAVDWDSNGGPFNNMWQSYRTRKNRKLELCANGHNYKKKGNHSIKVKVVDIFGNDTTVELEVVA